MRLTEVAVQRLSPTGSRVEYWDKIIPGLVLRVMPSGHKSWCFAYRQKGMRGQQRMSFGPFPEITVTRAREIVKEARADLAVGIDPMAKRKEKIEARRVLEQQFVTVEEMSEEFIEKYAKPRNRSWKQVQRSFKNHINPALGAMPAKEVQRKDVVRLIDKLKSSKHPHAANQVLVALRKMYNWAIERDELDFNPCHVIKKPVPTPERERVLTKEEIRVMWNACGDIGYTSDGLVWSIL